MAIEILNGEEVHTIYGDKKVAQEFYFVTVKKVEKLEEDLGNDNKIPKLEPQVDYELVVLDSSTNRFEDEIKETLVEFKDIFAWSSSDLRFALEKSQSISWEFPIMSRLCFRRNRYFLESLYDL